MTKDFSDVPASRLWPVWNLPTMLTCLRLVLVPLLAVLLWSDLDPSGRVVAAVVFATGVTTDFLDGHLARRWDQVTAFGKLADPIADKCLVGVALVGLSWRGELPWWVTGVVLARELAVTLLRWWLKRRGYGVMAAGPSGKLKMVAQSVAVTLYLLPLVGWWPDTAIPLACVLAVALGLTLWSGWVYFAAARRLVRA